MIRVEVKGIEAFRSKLFAFPERFKETIINNMSQIAFDSAEKSIGPHTKTGALSQSLQNVPIDGGRRVFNDPNRAPHAIFVHEGTAPHDIVPKDKKALRWEAPGGTGFIFAGKVKHPGTEADPYMDRAGKEAIDQFNKIVDEAFFAEWRNSNA